MSLTLRSDPGAARHARPTRDLREASRRWLLTFGIIYAVLYVVANDVIAATMYEGYDRVAQVISELSATGAPSQPFLLALAPVFNLLLIGFGVGVWRTAGGRRGLRVAGAILVAQGLTAFLWILGPMSQRETIATTGGSWRDDLHLVLSGLSVSFIIAQMTGGAVAFRGTFRAYSVASVVVFVVFAVATGLLSVPLSAGQSTPWLGVIERVMLGAWLLWMAVLGVVLLRQASAQTTKRDPIRSGRPSRPDEFRSK